jgi:hypothetical protein
VCVPCLPRGDPAPADGALRGEAQHTLPSQPLGIHVHVPLLEPELLAALLDEIHAASGLEDGAEVTVEAPSPRSTRG